MWIPRVKDETITLYSFSLTMLLIHAGLVFLQINAINDFFSLSGLGGLGLNKLLSDSNWLSIIFLISPFTIMLGLYWYSPLLITNIDKKNKRLAVVTYSLFGKRTREIGFEFLASYIKSSQEEYEDDTFYKLFIKLDSDETINLSSISTMWKWNAIKTKERANDFIIVSPKIVDMNKNEGLKLTILDD